MQQLIYLVSLISLTRIHKIAYTKTVYAAGLENSDSEGKSFKCIKMFESMNFLELQNPPVEFQKHIHHSKFG